MKILLVEDNPGDSRLVHEILKEARGSYTIFVAETLGRGLNLLLAQAVDVVLLDLNLPDSRGLETITKLQGQFPSLPIVIMTSIDDEELGVQAVQLGAQDYLVKGQVNSLLLPRILKYAVERKSIIESLSEKERFLELIAELNPATITVVDLINNQEIYSSKSTADRLVLLGYKPEEIKDVDTTGVSPSLIHPADLERLAAASSELKCAEDDRVRELTIRVKAADGRWRYFQILYRIFKRDPAGQPLQSMSVSRDITERKEAEEELRQRTAELESINNELEAFSYSVSHDLQAPLRKINSFIQILVEQESSKLDEQALDYFQRIQASNLAMSTLIDDLLRLSRFGRAELKIENVNLSELASSIALELRRAQPERKAEFIIAQGIICRGDQSLLRILLQNLLENAWKYTSKSEVARIEFGILPQDAEKVFFIKDNGVGFDMAYVGKLFQPFQRIHNKNEYPGTGIGLAIVQRIINRHRGKIWAEGEVGKGTTFYFTLRP